ncbi:MAG: hypothetical protein ACC645_23080, partial [Pirellulales bacterium]
VPHTNPKTLRRRKGTPHPRKGKRTQDHLKRRTDLPAPRRRLLRVVPRRRFHILVSRCQLPESVPS